jgi:arsenate reductase
MAAATGLKPNTLSHHLADLERAGLIRSERLGRSLLYSVDLARTGAILTYLAQDCGRGRPDLLAPVLAKPKRAIAQPYNVLFICSGNSARSIFAEAILNAVEGGQFKGWSAGTRPGSQLNPIAVEVLTRQGLNTTGLRAKHISEFEAPDAPEMDFVFTVCDAAASEDCAPWASQPISAHWGVPDPVKATGNDAEKGLAFARAYAELYRRIIAFAALPLDQLDRVALQRSIDLIGQPLT